MSDSVQSQAGGGEGTPAPVVQPAPAEPTPDPPKPVEPPTPAPEVKTEEPKEPKAEEVKELKAEKPQESKVEEVKIEAPQEIKAEVETKVEEKPIEEVKPEQIATVSAEATTVPEQSLDNQTTNGENSWQEREKQLLKKIEELEKVKNERTEDGLRLELKVREEEIDLLKTRVKNLETELQAAMSKPGGKNQEMIEKIKQQHEELLSKARGMIFDKTKMVKNQELQIEALTTQVASLKDINQITKDLLEIRNSEVKAMEDRLEVMEAKFKVEKNRYDLVLQRAQTSTNINDDLRKEYETQLAIFKELREKYEQRVQALVAENNKLKGTAKEGTSS